MTSKASGSIFRRKPSAPPIGVRVSMPDGSRPLVKFKPEDMPTILAMSEAELDELARAVSDEYRAGACVPAGTPLTTNEWFGKFYDRAAKGEVGRKNRGNPQVTIDNRRARYATHIAPLIGTIPIAEVTADHLRPVVRHLNDEIRKRKAFYSLPAKQREEREGRKPGLSPKSVGNIWGEVVSGFKEAVSSNFDDLRVRSDDPTRLVQPPTTDDDREQAPLFPSELTQWLACERVQLYRRINYAIGAYLAPRLGECRGLAARDIDLEHNLVYVRAQARASGARAKTKTRAGRRSIPIEPSIRPLLVAIVAVAEEEDAMDRPFLRLPPAEDCAELTRKDLLIAGVDRDELHADDEERRPFTFHALRHTAATHWSCAGKPIPWLLAAMGHTNYATAQGYIDSAAVLRESFGTPHPPLPAGFVDLAQELVRASLRQPKLRISQLKLATPMGIEDLGNRRDLQGKEPKSSPASATPERSATSRDVADPAPACPPPPGAHVDVRDEPSRTSGDETAEDRISRALDRASAAGEWAVVAQLAGELQARRLARTDVVRLDDMRAKRALT